MAKKSRITIGDIRVVIGSVLGIIGIFLLLCAAFTTSSSELAKSGGIHANLWAGIVLLIVALAMWAWAFINPQGGQSPDAYEDEATIEARHARVEGDR